MRNELFKQTITGALHLLNTTIIPAGSDGLYRATTITLDEAQRLFTAGVQAGDEGWGHYPLSHIGHESTAALMTAALGSVIAVDRTPWDGSGSALVLQMAGRPPEGKILTVEEMEAAGYTWRLLVRETDAAVWNAVEDAAAAAVQEAETA
jgi:hypothetical protein